MKVYAFVDLDGNLGLRNWDYINNDNPGFFIQNRDFIVKHWKIDTEDKSSLWRFLKYCTDFKIDKDKVLNFLKQLGIEPTKEKMSDIAHANRQQ